MTSTVNSEMDKQKKIRIVTHNGTFHADELLAVAALEIYLKDKAYEVIRTRDMEIIKSADYVVDVGGIYDSEIIVSIIINTKVQERETMVFRTLRSDSYGNIMGRRSVVQNK